MVQLLNTKAIAGANVDSSNETFFQLLRGILDLGLKCIETSRVWILFSGPGSLLTLYANVELYLEIRCRDCLRALLCTIVWWA